MGSGTSSCSVVSNSDGEACPATYRTYVAPSSTGTESVVLTLAQRDRHHALRIHFDHRSIDIERYRGRQQPGVTGLERKPPPTRHHHLRDQLLRGGRGGQKQLFADQLRAQAEFTEVVVGRVGGGGQLDTMERVIRHRTQTRTALHVAAIQEGQWLRFADGIRARRQVVKTIGTVRGRDHRRGDDAGQRHRDVGQHFLRRVLDSVVVHIQVDVAGKGTCLSRGNVAVDKRSLESPASSVTSTRTVYVPPSV